jgi:hypothetical protein
MNSKRQDSYVFRRLAKAFKAMLGNRHEDTGDREDEMAEILHIAKSYMNNMANGHAPIPADILVTAVREFGDAAPMQEMNRLCGLLAVPFPEGDAGERDVRALVDQFHATAEAFFEARDPKGPGGAKATREEAIAIEDAGRGLQAVVERIIQGAWNETKEAESGGRCKTLAETARKGVRSA